MTHPTSYVCSLTVASLEGLAVALSESVEEENAEQSVVALRVYGDAIRLGLEAPEPVRTWAVKLGAAHIDRALRTTDAALTGPAYRPEDDAAARALLDDEGVEHVFVERDWAESVLVAARRAMQADSFERCPGRVVLMESLDCFDALWGKVVSRETLFDLLGERAAFRPAYALRYPEASGAELAGEPKGDPSAALDEELPSDDMIARYVHGGAFARTVEAAAARDADFAETLEAIYDAQLEIGEVTSMRAGAWRRARRTPTARTKVTLTVSAPPVRAAAAATPIEDEKHWVQLGRDETLGCAFELSVEVLADSLVVHLDLAETGKIAEVRVGDVSVAVAADQDEVELRVARRTELAFVVRHRDGSEVRETFELVQHDEATR